MVQALLAIIYTQFNGLEDHYYLNPIMLFNINDNLQ